MARVSLIPRAGRKKPWDDEVGDGARRGQERAETRWMTKTVRKTRKGVPGRERHVQRHRGTKGHFESCKALAVIGT